MATSRFEDLSIEVEPAASADEAAAIAIAIQQLLAERQEAQTADEATVDPWLRAGRFESVRAFPGRPSPNAPRDPWVAMGRSRR